MIRLCSIKQLIALKSKQVHHNSVAAVICSSYEVNITKLSWIPNKLILCFDDITNAGNKRAFNCNHAQQIKRFIDGLDPKRLLYICCDSGQSRSAALTAATYRYLHKDEMIIWKDPHLHPNPLVYRIMCNVYGCTINRAQIWFFMRINHYVTGREIRNSRHRRHRHMQLER